MTKTQNSTVFTVLFFAFRQIACCTRKETFKSVNRFCKTRIAYPAFNNAGFFVFR